MAPLQQHIEDINDRVDANFNEAGTQIVAGNAVKDEDNMSSDSATHLATQQSIKAYVDTQIGASDLDLSADSGTNIAIDLDTEVLDLEGKVKRKKHFSGMRDHAIRDASCYDTVMVAVVARESKLLGLDFKFYDAAFNFFKAVCVSLASAYSLVTLNSF